MRSIRLNSLLLCLTLFFIQTPASSSQAPASFIQSSASFSHGYSDQEWRIIIASLHNLSDEARKREVLNLYNKLDAENKMNRNYVHLIDQVLTMDGKKFDEDSPPGKESLKSFYKNQAIHMYKDLGIREYYLDCTEAILKQKHELERLFPEYLPRYSPVAASPAVTSNANLTALDAEPGAQLALTKASPFLPGQKIVVYSRLQPEHSATGASDTLHLYEYTTKGWQITATIPLPTSEDGCHTGAIHSMAASHNLIRLGCHKGRSLVYDLNQEQWLNNFDADCQQSPRMYTPHRLTSVTYYQRRFMLGCQNSYYTFPGNRLDLIGTKPYFDYSKGHDCILSDVVDILKTRQCLFITTTPCHKPYDFPVPFLTVSGNLEEDTRPVPAAFGDSVRNYVSQHGGQVEFDDQVYLSLAYDQQSDHLCFMAGSYRKEIARKKPGHRDGICVHNPHASKPASSNDKGFHHFPLPLDEERIPGFIPEFVTATGQGLILAGGSVKGSAPAIYALDMQATDTTLPVYRITEPGYEALTLEVSSQHTPELATFIP